MKAKKLVNRITVTPELLEDAKAGQEAYMGSIREALEAHQIAPERAAAIASLLMGNKPHRASIGDALEWAEEAEET